MNSEEVLRPRRFYAILHINGEAMSLLTIEINFVKLTFDKDKTI